jgi:hypothetical protein
MNEAIRDAGGISIPVTVDPSTMQPGFEEVKRIIARSEQDTEILKLIAGYLKSIDDKSGGGARLN